MVVEELAKTIVIKWTTANFYSDENLLWLKVPH